MLSLLTDLFKRQTETPFHLLLSEYNKTRPQKQNFSLCYAPFKALYFGHRGLVTACCYNRLQSLGRWPQNSISEIWNGPMANELREELKKNSLQKGCDACAIQFEAKNFSGFKAAQFDMSPLNANGFPSVFEFELDNTCNLECIMCSPQFSSSIANRMGIKKHAPVYNGQFVTQLEEFIPHLHEAKFYGGEPFMIPIYYDIWDKIVAINPNCHILVQTNATQLNTRIKDILEKGRFYFNISLDSLEKDNYEKIRVNADFDRVMENINYLHQYAKRKNTLFEISVCPIKNNWHEISRFIEYGNENDIGIYCHTVFHPKHLSLQTITVDEKRTILETYKSVKFKDAVTEIQKRNLRHFRGLINQIESIEDGVEENPFQNWEDLYAWLTEYPSQTDPSLTMQASKFVSHFKQAVSQMNLENDYRLPQRISKRDFEGQFKMLIMLEKERICEMLENAAHH